MGDDNGAEGNELVHLLEPFWSAQRTMEALGVDQVGLDRARADSSVLQVTTSDEVPLFPTWQFVRTNNEVRVWPGLQAVLRVLEDEDQWAVAVLIKSPEPVPELGGRPLLEAIRDGTSDEALKQFADLVRREWR